jgi:hypothetical protein
MALTRIKVLDSTATYNVNVFNVNTATVLVNNAIVVVS